ncbi:hypothetical protein PVK06_035223 [Gossypium arboreum]|uniref:Uncharacterized protein n=1 Tax=Gossypium arboreum TaxID=29729 RepID=A0ABR0NG85_GOSAR|nr:hypothetical protein PVK06_035223 [Gossypium arboreum]
MAKATAVKHIELSIGSITRAIAKKFQGAISCYIDRIWGEEVAGLIDQSWTSTSCVPCSLLQAKL